MERRIGDAYSASPGTGGAPGSTAIRAPPPPPAPVSTTGGPKERGRVPPVPSDPRMARGSWSPSTTTPSPCTRRPRVGAVPPLSREEPLASRTPAGACSAGTREGPPPMPHGQESRPGSARGSGVLASAETVQQGADALITHAVGNEPLAFGVGVAGMGTGRTAEPGEAHREQDRGDDRQNQDAAPREAAVGTGELETGDVVGRRLRRDPALLLFLGLVPACGGSGLLRVLGPLGPFLGTLLLGALGVLALGVLGVLGVLALGVRVGLLL